MIDFNTAVQTVLSPVVTVPVIALLTGTVAYQWYDNAQRLKAQSVKSAAKFGRLSAQLAVSIIKSAEKEMKRRETAAVLETLKVLDGVLTDDMLYGGGNSPFSMRRPSPMFRARRDRETAPFNSFTMGDLLDAVTGFKPRHDAFDPEHVGGGSGLARGGSPSVDDYIADLHKQNPMTYDHNAGPLEAAHAEGRTHADVMDETTGGNGGTTLRKTAAPRPATSDHHTDFGGQSPRAG